MSRGQQKAKGRVTGSAGRFGPRYGRFIRKRVVETERISRAAHRCPRCDTISVKRQGTGIWACRKCGFKFAGGAYTPQTPALRIALRAIDRTMEGKE
ncbi:MAG: 50S ribosomal protein L37Ae [Methanoregulaceae archaeon PtaB.Bin009]|jgi:large subunit ribosomal protein L37Ae|nr:MAG: 50S ribosomal protein L37Ae [Methanoregulaceae archaeon PtaB.Bin009]OPY40808.1 MAG: 50S ribosomal protein L37Ae [Methanoregulaceae archaeon PtaU1.Bin066]HNQ29866.1 50S ribosomal protein L37ae [Methanolinea sp.]HNS82260.1 50S ribosomal protein L37ae [Methanolinea sp.]